MSLNAAHMNRIFLYLFLAGFFCSAAAYGQDTLPSFSVRNLGNNRIIIGWVNTYPLTKQISIQRSFDSLKNYKTIMSVTDPSAIQNGFADTKAPNDHMYYRLFVNLDKGEFFFTTPKKPFVDTLKAQTAGPANPVLSQKTKDSLSISIKQPAIKKPEFVPSFFVYTNRDGYIFLNLPDADRKKYRIRFYEEDESFLFELKDLKESALTLDKANFGRSGWFRFELFDDEKLLEKNKFFLAKEF
jgi:hypothetical protein